MCARFFHTDPHLLQFQLLVLWSINERLSGKKGLNLPIPTMEWVNRLPDLAKQEAEEVDALTSGGKKISLPEIDDDVIKGFRG